MKKCIVMLLSLVLCVSLLAADLRVACAAKEHAPAPCPTVTVETVDPDDPKDTEPPLEPQDDPDEPFEPINVG